MSTMQRWARRDPQPVGTGWEIACVAVTAVLLLLGLGGLTGRAAAAAVFGGGWVWPRHGAWLAALGGLLAGHPAAGLPAADAARLPSAAAVYAGVVLTELVALALLTAGGVGWARYRRPGDARGGMATRREAVGGARGRSAARRPADHPPRPVRTAGG